MRDSVFPVTLIAVGGVWLLFNPDWVPERRGGHPPPPPDPL